MRARFVAVLALACAGTAGSQAPCPRATLPAYAHNDYENRRPLTEALDLGFRGVEADVFLVRGILRVGHDQRSANSGRTLEELYLEPLRAIVAHCGTLTEDGRPFLFAIEIKENSPPTYAAMLELLARYRSLFVSPPGSERSAAVEVVLVGWHPPVQTLRQHADGLIRLQHRVAQPEDSLPASKGWTRLVSLDYGKTMGRRWVTHKQRTRWLATLREIKRAAPQLLLRVHNVPPDRSHYAALLDAGVDLIGTKDLAATRRLLIPTAARREVPSPEASSR